MSDLHIKAGATYAEEERQKRIIGRMLMSLVDFKKPHEELLVLFCGDIVDRGDANAFKNAKVIIDYLDTRLKQIFKSVSYRFVPGNHDLCNSDLRVFDHFIDEYTGEQSFPFSDEDVYAEQIGGINFIYANTFISKEHNVMDTNWYLIEEYVSDDLDNIIVAHRGFTSERESSIDRKISSSVNGNAMYFKDSFCRKTICFYLHGDTHIAQSFNLDDKPVFGVGPLFSTWQDVSSQFNLFYVNKGKVEKAYKYSYDGDNEIFRQSQIFPRAGRIGQICESGKIQYDFSLNYINRKIAPFSIVQSGSFALYFAQDEQTTLLKACKEKKRIVLLGEAGCGKSFELKQLAAQISNNISTQYYPVYIDLRNYTTKEIDELIPREYSGIDTEQLFFIFDGFDEIESKNIFSFARRLTEFSKINPNTSIVVSARNNFYTFRDDNEDGGTLSGFEEYGLCPLDADDMKAYATNQEIDYEQFQREVYLRNLRELTYNPFYFVELIKLYKEQSQLPVKSDLMASIIDSRYRADTEKFMNTKDLRSSKYEVNQLLGKLSFAMQCMQKTHLPDDDYQQLCSPEERSLIRHSGIWNTSDNESWAFDHNNFREYLVAKQLAALPLGGVVELITYPDDRNSIKPSWVNVLSFLTQLYNGDELLEWLMKANPELIVKFEPARIDVKVRSKIFISILEDFKRKNMWISHGLNNLYEFAQFGQSNESLNYLLQEIQDSTYFRSQNNALNMLSCFDNLFSRETEVRDVLIACCADERVRDYEKRIALTALAELKFRDTDTADMILKIFENSKSPKIWSGIYRYLLEANLQDDYVDYFLMGVSSIKWSDSDSNCSSDISRGLLKVKSYSAISKSIKRLTEKENVYLHFYNSEEIFDHLCVRATELYLSGTTEVFEDIIGILGSETLTLSHKYLNSVIQFFNDTGTILEAFDRIARQEYKHEYQRNTYLRHITGDQYDRIVFEKYKNNTLYNDQIFIDLVSGMSEEEPTFKEYRKAIFEKDGIEIAPTPRIDYGQKRKDSLQNFFNSLFDQNAFIILLDELIEFLGVPEITYDELIDKYFDLDYEEKRQDFSQIIFSIKENKFEDRIAKNFFYHAPWELYSIDNIYCTLKNNDKQIIVSDSQRNHIEQYCRNNIADNDIKTLVTHTHDEMTYYSLACYLAFFSSYFDFKYEDAILLDMLLYPPTLFANNDEERFRSFPAYLVKNLSPQAIASRVEFNLRNMNLEGWAAESHLEYCNDFNLSSGIKLAEEIIKSADKKEYTKRIAFEYVLNLKGGQYVCDNFLPTSDNVLLPIFAEKLMPTRNAELEKCLVEGNEKSESGLLYLEYLIRMNSLFGLKRYYSIALESFSIPDYSTGRNICLLTEAIKAVNDIHLLPQIVKLIKLQTSPGFKDVEAFGLSSALYSAVINIAEHNYDIVQENLSEILEKSPENQAAQAFCNSLLDEIKRQYYVRKDEPWQMREVREYFERS